MSKDATEEYLPARVSQMRSYMAFLDRTLPQLPSEQRRAAHESAMTWFVASEERPSWSDALRLLPPIMSAGDSPKLVVPDRSHAAAAYIDILPESFAEEQLCVLFGDLCVQRLKESQPAFAFTRDIVARLGLLSTLYAAGVPVIMRGETGTGKTYLVRCLGLLLDVAVHVLDVFDGVTESDVYDFVNRCALVFSIVRRCVFTFIPR